MNGEAITLEDFYQSTRHRPPLPPEVMRDKRNQKFGQDPRHMKRYLDKAIEQELLLQESLKLELDKDPFKGTHYTLL